MKQEKNKPINALWRNILVLVMILVGGIFGVSNVSATLTPIPPYSFCYQETANTSTSSDGKCGALNYTGVYGFANTPVNQGNSIDGNWNTYTSSSGALPYDILINYSKPIYVSNVSIWRYKYQFGSDSAVTANTTIPSHCFNAHTGKIVLHMWAQYAGTNIIGIRCYNATGYTDIGSFSRAGSSVSRRIYEEGIYWNTTTIIENNKSYNAFSNEYKTEQFIYNINYNSDYFTSMNSVLVYNNTDYITTKTETDGNIIFNTTLTTPLVTNTRNISFYWKLLTYNGTAYVNYTTESYNQTVYDTIFGICNATNQIKLLNFSIMDEETKGVITGGSFFNIDMKIGNNDLTDYTQYKANVTASSLAICSNTTITSMRLDYTIQYGATAYPTEYVHLQYGTINTTSIGQNVTLYLSNSTSITAFLIKVVDQNYVPLESAVVEVHRYYVELGNTLLVEAPITDSLGQAIVHLYKNDIMYTFVIKKNGVVLATFSKIQAYCNILTQECTISLNIQGVTANPESFLQYRNVNYLPTYDTSTHTYSVEYSTTDNSIKNVSIYGWKLTNTQNESVCNNNLLAQSGTINCVFPSAYQNSTILINVFVDGELLFKDYVISDYKKTDTLKNIRYILLAFLIPFFAMFSLASGSLAIVFYIIGLIFGIGIFALDTQSFVGAGSFLIWFIVAGIILIFKIMKGGVKNG